MALVSTTASTNRRRATLHTAAALLAVALVAAACSSNGHSTTTTGSSGSTQSTPTTSRSSGLVVGSRTVSKVGDVLVGPSGNTLYHDDADSRTRIACTGGCAQAWPPLTVSAGTMPTLASGVPGTVGTVQRPDGSTQVTYDNLPLYYFSGDSHPGQANGQALDGIWFVINPTTGAVGSGSTTSTSASGSTTTSGGSSY